MKVNTHSDDFHCLINFTSIYLKLAFNFLCYNNNNYARSRGDVRSNVLISNIKILNFYWLYFWSFHTKIVVLFTEWSKLGSFAEFLVFLEKIEQKWLRRSRFDFRDKLKRHICIYNNGTKCFFIFRHFLQYAIAPLLFIFTFFNKNIFNAIFCIESSGLYCLF